MSSSNKRERELARQAGFAHHLAKPADFNELLALLPPAASEGTRH